MPKTPQNPQCGWPPNGFLSAAVCKAVAARIPVASDIDQLVAPAVPEPQEDGSLSPNAADIRPDALGLPVDIDADASVNRSRARRHASRKAWLLALNQSRSIAC